MKRRLPPLAGLRVFECAARHMSFTRAAEELSVTQAAISHQVKSLEEWFGYPLFVRGGRSISLTDQGERLLPGLTLGFDTLAESVAKVAGGSAQPLRIATLDSFIAEWLIARLHRFMERCPDTNLRFVTATQEGNALATGDADVEIRYGAGDWPNVDAIELFREDIFPVCSPSLIEGASLTGELSDLANFDLLHDVMSIKWREFLEKFGAETEDVSRGLGFSNSHLVITAAISGYGVALGRELLVADALRAGTLVRPWEQTLNAPFAYYLVLKPDSAVRGDLAELVSWFREEAERYNTRKAPLRSVS